MSVNFNKIDGPWPVGPVPEPHRNGNGAGAAKGADFARDLSVASALPSPPPASLLCSTFSLLLSSSGRHA